MLQSGQNPEGIGGTLPGHHIRRGLPQRGQHAGDACNFGRLVARRDLLPIGRTPQPGRRDVRCVRLQHQRRLWEAARQATDLQRTIKCHGTPDTQRKTEPQKLSGLLQAAVEGVRDAANTRMTTQLLEQLIL